MKLAVKKITIFFVLILSVLLALPFAFSGDKKADAASAYRGDYICLSCENYNDGRVAWGIEFGLNTEKRGLADDDEKATYRVKIQTMLQEIFLEKRAEIEGIYALNSVEGMSPVECITYTNPLYDQQADCAGFKFFFKNAQAYNFYNTKENDESKVIDNIFINKQIKRTIFPFAQMADGDSTIARHYLDMFIKACEGLSIENAIKTYDPEFIFDYSSYSKKIKSNADLKYTDASGKYHHAWGERVANINATIVTSRSLTQPKRGTWYAFGVAVPLAGMAIAIAVIKIREKINKNKTQKTA